jgi:hypothetical protein
MDLDKISNLYRGPSIDASYQVSVNMAEGFQRRRLKCEKLTDDRRRMPSDDKSSHCLWQGELKMKLSRKVITHSSFAVSLFVTLKKKLVTNNKKLLNSYICHSVCPNYQITAIVFFYFQVGLGGGGVV